METLRRRGDRLGARFLLAGGCAGLFFAFTPAISGCRSSSSNPGQGTQSAVPAKAQPAAVATPPPAVPVQSPVAQADPSDDGTLSRYVNTKYSYHLHYPSTGQLDESNPAHVTITFDVPLANGRGHDELTFEIAVEPQPKNFDLKTWAQSKQDEADAQPIQPLTVGGSQAYSVRELGGDATTSHVYLAAAARIFDLSYADPETMGELPTDVRRHYTQILHNIQESFSFDISPE